MKKKRIKMLKAQKEEQGQTLEIPHDPLYNVFVQTYNDLVEERKKNIANGEYNPPKHQSNCSWPLLSQINPDAVMGKYDCQCTPSGIENDEKKKLINRAHLVVYGTKCPGFSVYL